MRKYLTILACCSISSFVFAQLPKEKKQTDQPPKISPTIISSAEPLYLVDSVEVPREHLAEIKPENIESVVVLKDAASTALYGEKGKNGVVLIHTKDKDSAKTKPDKSQQ